MFSKMSSDGSSIGGRLALVAWCIYFLPIGILSFLHFRNRWKDNISLTANSSLSSRIRCLRGKHSYEKCAILFFGGIKNGSDKNWKIHCRPAKKMAWCRNSSEKSSVWPAKPFPVGRTAAICPILKLESLRYLQPPSNKVFPFPLLPLFRHAKAPAFSRRGSAAFLWAVCIPFHKRYWHALTTSI